LDHESLVGISEASQTLGISEATLRQWTDEGRIKAFITPGGHRRYSKAELKRFLRSHSKTLGIKDLVVELEDTTRLHREIARRSMDSSAWYHKLGQDSRERLAILGRRLLDLIIRYMTEPSKRPEILAQARDVGRSHGETLADIGLPLTDSVEAFISHRGPIVDAITHLMRKREAVAGRVVDAIPMISRVMDEALISLVAAYQQNRDADQIDSGGTAVE
jgi:excisionase family DNA binding protein